MVKAEEFNVPNKIFSQYLILASAFAVSIAMPQTASAFKNVHNHKIQSSLIVHVADDAVENGAQKFVDSVAQRGIGFLGNQNLSDSQRQREFKKLLEDSFDMKTIGRFALGRHWRSASDAQKKEYLALFKKMVVEVYSDRFKEYNGQELKVVSARAEGKADAIVTSKIIPDEGPDIQIDWRVRFKNGRYKVVDIVVEGVSMALTQRSDFSSVIQRGGGDVGVLLDHLRES